MAKLIPISNCENSSRCGDIVFVHGLNGNAHNYWYPPGEKEKHWPQCLGEDLPSVGIWALEYENAALKRRGALSNFFGFKNSIFGLQCGIAMPLFDRATNVLLSLTLSNIGEKPLIFITHSMGGLLVKQLLRQANESQNPQWRAVLSQTKGVCYIATPHIGSDLADLAKYFNFFLKANVSVTELEPHLPNLRSLNDWYRDYVTQNCITINTISFFETQPINRVAGLVVKAGDADPGIAHSKPIPLDEDHFSICKPKSKDSLIYAAVLRFIKVTCFNMGNNQILPTIVTFQEITSLGRKIPPNP